MLYKLAHLLRDKFPFVWNGVEWLNALLFFLLYRKRLSSLAFDGLTEEYVIRPTSSDDVPALVAFFKAQPETAFKFFHPHGFDRDSVAKVVANRSFLTYVVLHDEEIVGYFFLRCFLNGKGYRGRMVDYRWNNKGIGKLMSKALNRIALSLRIRIYSTISPENYASLASMKAICGMKIIKTLENGYHYIEILPL